MAINCVLNERNLLSSSRAHSNNLYNWYYKSSKAYIYKKKFLAKTKAPKLISNHSMVVSGVYFNPFQGSQGPQEGSEAKILTFWPKKSFYGNAHISGTRRPTGLAQVSKRPWEQWLHAGPFRWSLFPLVCLSGFVIASVCIFHGFGKKSYFSAGANFFGWNGPCMGQEPLKWILARPSDVPWVVSDQKSPKK